MPTDRTEGDSGSTEEEQDRPRRDIIKFAGMASVGALGSLAGCASGGSQEPPGVSGSNGSSGGNGGAQEPGVGGSNSSGNSSGGDGGSEGSTSLDYWSAIASETPKLNQYFKEGMREFEEINNGKVTVNLQALSHDNIKNKFATTIESGGGIPDFAMSGTLGLQQHQNGNVIDHGPYIEETEGIPDKWTGSQKQSGQYRGAWWAAGAPAQGSTQFGILNEPFKQIGIKNPHKELNTWTKMRRAFDKIKSQTDYYAYEVLGTSGDVEAYWGNARTSYKDGTDPWLDVEDEGSPQNPVIKIGQEGRTDGMIYNEIELGEEYSSPGHPSRGDEDVYPMMIQGQVASQAYSAGVRALKAIDKSIKFGWDDGRITAVKTPKLDPNYGNEFNIPELADKEGMHGGHTWTLETQLTIQEASEAKDQAWELAKFRLLDKRFLIPLLVQQDLNQSPSTYQPILDIQRQEKYEKNRTQPVSLALEQIAEYDNFRTTGAVWDVPGTSTIRMSNFGDTLSQAYADEFPTEEAPTKMAQAVRSTLEDNGISPQ